MRIISGEFKGRKLVSPAGNATRPTSDRVRESIFSILGGGIINARVLDLFAGTGAFGLEALSRGAAESVFIDASAGAIKIIRKNITACGAESRVRIIRWDIAKNLNCLQPLKPAFDLIFMDPPYDRNFIAPTLEKLIKAGALQSNTKIVIEHAAGEIIPEDLNALHQTDRRTYGKTLVSFLSVVLQKTV